MQTIAALKHYGLLEDAGGTKDERKVRLTDLARRIILDERDSSPERDAMIKAAALNPKLFEGLWRKWGETGLPSPNNIRYHLFFDRDFNENAVDEVVKIFLETIKFAGLEAGQGQDGEEESDVESDDERLEIQDEQHSSTTTRRDAPPPPPTPPANMNQDTSTLDEGKVILQWPTELSADSVQDLEDWLELRLRRIKRNLKKAPDDPEGDD